MPGFDRTGPFGAGPRTGWGAGLCGAPAGRGTSVLGGIFRGVGRGGIPWGGGRGRCFGGRGARWGSGPFAGAAPLSSTEETEVLKAQLAATENELAAMKARLEELEKKE
ncbi:MAG: DUF5320 domain-containing protein [Desulfomonilaceae bacterium]